MSDYLGKREREERVKQGLPLDRRLGRTTRMIWRALLDASERPDAMVVIASPHGARHRDWLFQYVVDLARPVGAQAVRAERRITFSNGTVVRVESSEGLEDRLRGTQAMVFYDHW